MLTLWASEDDEIIACVQHIVQACYSVVYRLIEDVLRRVCTVVQSGVSESRTNTVERCEMSTGLFELQLMIRFVHIKYAEHGSIVQFHSYVVNG